VPELPEVETVRRMLESHVLGRVTRSVRLSSQKLRSSAIPAGFAKRLTGRRLLAARRHGKYLMIDWSDGLTLLSHLGMSGRWLFYPDQPPNHLEHVHLRVEFADGSRLWFQDPRRFGLLRLVPTERLDRDPSLALLGPDPIATPPTAEGLMEIARNTRIAVKNFLLDQRRLAGIGNIYASEILHRAAVDPRRRSGLLGEDEWRRIAAEIPAVLTEATERMGTTFSMYRTLWNEPGTYGDRLTVYDRAGEPCLICGTPIRRIVQGQRSTFFCPSCQAKRKGTKSRIPQPRRGGRPRRRPS